MHETGFIKAWVPHDANNCSLTVFTAVLLYYATVVLLLYVCSIIHALCFVLAKSCSLKTKQSNILSNTLKSLKL
jgi:hypothetical protein